MKYLVILFTGLILIVTTSCTKEKLNITSMDITLSKVKILGDGVDNSVITAYDQNSNDITGSVSIYVNGKAATDPVFKTATSGVYKISASYNSILSDTLTCEVVPDVGLKFVKPVLLEQYTGTWCGWCPRAISNIESIQSTDNNIVHMALHLSDSYSYSQNAALFQSFGFTGIPTVHADRNSKWEGESYIIGYLHSPSRAGLSLEVTGNALQIDAAIKVKFGNSFDDGLKLSVYLLHDSIVSTQANYYNTDPSSKYYQKGDVMSGFIHRNILIKSGLDMFGEAIPAESVDIGSIFSKSVYFTSFRCDNIKYLRVAAVLTYASGKKKGQVVNCIIARVGEKKDFDVATK